MTHADPQFKLRFPLEVKEWLEKEASRNLRSVTAEINIAIRERMERETVGHHGLGNQPHRQPEPQPGKAANSHTPVLGEPS